MPSQIEIEGRDLKAEETRGWVGLDFIASFGVLSRFFEGGWANW